MYLEHFGLNEPPFSITPDPRYVFLSDRHREALAHLLYGVGQGGGSGFVQLTGEVGTGKTTLCRLLLGQLPDNTRVALILNPKLSPLELLASICEELGVEVAARKDSQKDLVDALNHYLLDAYAQGLRVVLIVDEAQQLSVAALEQIRLLTNLETPTQKLLQIILLGQPELRPLLAKPELRQLAQRITARYHLEPLDREETATYVRHRLQVAGMKSIPFTRLALIALHQRSAGIPRVINIIADRALTAGFALDQNKLGESLVQRAADEALPGHFRHWWRRARPWLAWGAVLAVLLGGLGMWRYAHTVSEPTHVSAPSTPAPTTAAASALQAALTQTSTDAPSTAWPYLFARWQVTAAEADVGKAHGCPATIAPGLHCVRGSGSLRQIQQFDRPVLLVLSGPEAGREHLAVLLGSGEATVRLRYGGEDYDLPKGRLAEFWQGRFMAIFRVPAEVPPMLQGGDAGPATAWVAAQLAAFDGGADRAHGPSFFDADLQARVRRLQQGFGLVADGIVGPETLFALASLNDAGPHLAHGVP